MKIATARAAADKSWDKLNNLKVCWESKVRAKAEVIHEVQNKKVPVHFATLMVLSRLQHSEIIRKSTMDESCFEETLSKTNQDAKLVSLLKLQET